MSDYEIRKAVQQKYAQAITEKTGSCGDSSCCSFANDMNTSVITGGLYGADEVNSLPKEAVNASFGCGNPTALAELYAGEIVLDLGSGAGLDVLLSARRVGPHGKAYGLDMTDEMLSEANANKARQGAQNVEFLKGYIEEIPLPDAAVDVVISNCVINLSVDKSQVFREIYRVLKPGGRVAVSDIVVTKALPDGIKQDMMAWAGCMAGALLDDEYKAKLQEVGFRDVEVEVVTTYDLKELFTKKAQTLLSDKILNEWDGALVSAFIRAKKSAE